MNAIEKFAKEHGAEYEDEKTLAPLFKKAVQDTIGNIGKVPQAWTYTGSDEYGYVDWEASVVDVDGMIPGDEIVIVLSTNLENGHSWIGGRYMDENDTIVELDETSIGDPFDAVAMINELMAAVQDERSSQGESRKKSKGSRFCKMSEGNASDYDGKYYVDIEDEDEDALYSSDMEFDSARKASMWAFDELKKSKDDDDVFQASVYQLFVNDDGDLDHELVEVIHKSDLDESKKNERGSTQIETYDGFDELLGYADAEYLLEDVVDVLSKYYTYEGEGDDIVFDEDQAKDDPGFSIKIEGGDERADFYSEDIFYVHLPNKEAAEELAKVLGGELSESKKPESCKDGKKESMERCDSCGAVMTEYDYDRYGGLCKHCRDKGEAKKPAESSKKSEGIGDRIKMGIDYNMFMRMCRTAAYLDEDEDYWDALWEYYSEGGEIEDALVFFDNLFQYTAWCDVDELYDEYLDDKFKDNSKSKEECIDAAIDDGDLQAYKHEKGNYLVIL